MASFVLRKGDAIPFPIFGNPRKPLDMMVGTVASARRPYRGLPADFHLADEGVVSAAGGVEGEMPAEFGGAAAHEALQAEGAAAIFSNGSLAFPRMDKRQDLRHLPFG